MQTLKHNLQSLFEGKNPKSYVRLINSRPHLQEQIAEYQKIINSRSVMETVWCILNGQQPLICDCGNRRVFNTLVLGYRPTCGQKCPARWEKHSQKIKPVGEDQEKLEQMVQKRKATCLNKYGVENAALSEEVKSRIKNTNLIRYGASSPFESKQIQEKIKTINLDRYGVEFPFQSKQIQSKSEISFRKNNPSASDKMALARSAFVTQYGSNPFAVESIKQKIKKTLQEKYGYVHALQQHLSSRTIEILENRDLFIKSVQGLTLAEAGESLGVNPTTVARRAITYNCREIFSTATRSKWEFKILTLLLEIGLIEGSDFIRSDRSILKGRELDFYFPKIGAAIEVGSVFWHSEVNAGRGNYYHYNKWLQCRDQGISLYQYWDYELNNSWEVIAGKIRYLFKRPYKVIGGRSISSIKPVPLEEERAFLSAYHIQGFSGDRKCSYGAYHNGVLIALIAVATRSDAVEVVRYATDLKASYPGLFSKLLKFALETLNLNHCRVISFSDNRHSSGNLYASAGFEIRHHSKSTYYYTRDYHSVENKKKYTKSKIASKFGVDANGKTEWQLMQELGYDRIWDAGKILWEKTFEKK